jgi:hypothetical protein
MSTILLISVQASLLLILGLVVIDLHGIRRAIAFGVRRRWSNFRGRMFLVATLRGRRLRRAALLELRREGIG